MGVHFIYNYPPPWFSPLGVRFGWKFETNSMVFQGLVFQDSAIICQLEYKFDYLDGNKKPLDNSKGFLCTHDTIRTCDLRIRSPLLYPAELRGHSHLI